MTTPTDTPLPHQQLIDQLYLARDALMAVDGWSYRQVQAIRQAIRQLEQLEHVGPPGSSCQTD